MGFFQYLRSSRKGSANTAKERLQIIVAREGRSDAGGPDYLRRMQRELLAVVRKYVAIEEDHSFKRE